jgi:membrane-bound ClpP family serine protease
MRDGYTILTLGLLVVSAAASVLKRRWVDALLMTGIGLMVLDHYLPGAGWLGILLSGGIFVRVAGRRSVSHTPS